jgi:hypothetical protein
MKKSSFILLITCLNTILLAAPVAPWNLFPFAPAAGQSGSTAVHKNDPRFIGWADGYENYIYGEECAVNWRTPENALGKADCGGENPYPIVCLGRGGEITLMFSQSIIDGDGYDFAVFENGFTAWGGGDFLELAWVEVSSDGEHFVRFPNYSATADPVPNYGTIFTYNLYNIASKYIQGYGHPFDLNELQDAYDQVLVEKPVFFTDDYAAMLTNNFPHLDLNDIRYVRLIDIVGNGTAFDTAGSVIYDSYPTLGSAGFDLDAVGVFHQIPLDGELQTIAFPDIPNQKLSKGSITLSATSDSGLPVNFSVQSGPATVSGSILTFTTNGVVEVLATQDGDATYAPAAPVLRSFHIADNLQHIYIDLVPNLTTETGTWQIHASADSGLPVYIEVSEGPVSTMVDTNTQVLTVGPNTGHVRLRATQGGNETHAPAEDVYAEFNIVESGASNAPQTFAAWCSANGLPSEASADSDSDGAPNLQEYVMGTNPLDNSDIPQLTSTQSKNQYGEPVFKLTYTVSLQSYGRAQMQAASSLTEPDWNDARPETVSTETITRNGTECVQITLQMPMNSISGFIRLLLQE